MSKLEINKRILSQLCEDPTSKTIKKVVRKYGLERVNEAMDWASQSESFIKSRIHINNDGNGFIEHFIPNFEPIKNGNCLGLDMQYRMNVLNNPDLQWFPVSGNPFKVGVETNFVAKTQKWYKKTWVIITGAAGAASAVGFIAGVIINIQTILTFIKSL